MKSTLGSFFSRLFRRVGDIGLSGIFANGKTNLCYIAATMDKEKNTKVFEELLVLCYNCTYITKKQNFVFMQKNAAVYTSRDCERCHLRLKGFSAIAVAAASCPLT